MSNAFRYIDLRYSTTVTTIGQYFRYKNGIIVIENIGYVLLMLLVWFQIDLCN